MVTIVLSQGEAVQVVVADSDGSFEIRYSETELTVSADLPGSHLGGSGLIYREVFNGCTCTIPSVDEKCPTHGLLGCNEPIAELDHG